MELHDAILLFVYVYKCCFIPILCSETIRLEIHGDRGHIQTPNYPSSYPLNFTSFWIIRGPRGSILQLNFTDFDVEDNKKCLYDYVSIGNTEGQLTSKYCGTKIPAGVTSSSGNFFIHFVSDSTTARRGFKAKWVALRAKGEPTPTSTQSLSIAPVECKTRHIITVTDPPCPEPSKETVTIKSCHCPSSSPAITTYAATNTLVVVPPLIQGNSHPLPVKPISGGVDDHNNTIADNCAQGRDKQINGSETANNDQLVIILGALAVVFFFTDVLLIFLWCFRYKRRHNAMAHSCRTALPPMELKIVDGKVISSPRRPTPRVKFSDDDCINGKPHIAHECKSRPHLNDGNDNLKGDQGLDLLKNSRCVYQTDSSQLVTCHHAE